MPRISVQSAKAKGRLFQQWVRDQILALFLSLEPDDVTSRSMGAGGTDILLSPAAKRKFPYAVECKRYASISIYSWWDQATTNAGLLEPILFVRADRRSPLVVIDAEHFFELIKTIDESKNK